jgi:hypothetical protein
MTTSSNASSIPQTPYLKRFLQSVEVLERCYCVSHRSIEQFYLWINQQPPETPIQFNYPGTVQLWHDPITVGNAIAVAPVVVGSNTVNTILTLTMWLEGYLRNMCRVLYQHTQDGTWLIEPKLHRVDWKVVESITGVKFADVLANDVVTKAFNIRDFSFRYDEEPPDPGVSRDELLVLLADVKRFAIDFEAAFFCEHVEIDPATVGTPRDPRYKK